MKQLRGWLGLLMGVMIGWMPVIGQDSPPSYEGREDPYRPTEYGIRFTPSMARAMAQHFAKDVAVRRYQLDDSKVEEVTNTVSRKLMEMAHKLDKGNYNESLEKMVNKIMEAEIDADRNGSPPGIHPKSAKAMAEAMKPFTPLLREAFQGIAQEIRPMLGAKEQLKLGADMLAFQTGLDAFEKNMQRWETGDVQPFENPVQPSQAPVLDKDGQSQAYASAKKLAEREVESGEWIQWQMYVEDAKKLYGFDESQAATADSVLRECLDRVKTLSQDPHWRDTVFRNRVWRQMLWDLQPSVVHPLRSYLDDTYGGLQQSVRSISQELKRRIDAIPTGSQRQTADERIIKLLHAQGYDFSAASQPAQVPDSQEQTTRPVTKQTETDRAGESEGDQQSGRQP